jgi:sugar lactone lactonase YvrE
LLPSKARTSNVNVACKMLVYASVLVAGVAVWLALENHPHPVPPRSASSRSPAPLTGAWEPNNELTKRGAFIAKGKITKAETVFVRNKETCDGAVAPDCRGRIWSLPTPEDADQSPKLLTHVGGTLLGGAFDRHGNIYVADATRGLLMIPNRTILGGTDPARIVATTAPSERKFAAAEGFLDDSEIRFADDIVIDPVSGFVYFTDATRIAPVVSSGRRGDTMNSFITSHLSGEASGRVLCYVPSTGATYVLARSLRFANGIGLSSDRTHLIVAATSSYELYKVPTLPDSVNSSTAPDTMSAEDLELFYNGALPGFADGLTVDENGHIWVSINGPVPPTALLADKAPAWFRHVLVRAPHVLRPGPSSLHSMFAEFSSTGELLRVLQDRERRFGILSSVERCGRYLYSGSVHENHVARILVD